MGRTVGSKDSYKRKRTTNAERDARTAASHASGNRLRTMMGMEQQPFRPQNQRNVRARGARNLHAPREGPQPANQVEPQPPANEGPQQPPQPEQPPPEPRVQQPQQQQQQQEQRSARPIYNPYDRPQSRRRAAHPPQGQRRGSSTASTTSNPYTQRQSQAPAQPSDRGVREEFAASVQNESGQNDSDLDQSSAHADHGMDDDEEVLPDRHSDDKNDEQKDEDREESRVQRVQNPPQQQPPPQQPLRAEDRMHLASVPPILKSTLGEP